MTLENSDTLGIENCLGYYTYPHSKGIWDTKERKQGVTPAQMTFSLTPQITQSNRSNNKFYFNKGSILTGHVKLQLDNNVPAK